jgi:TetR/AcrR family transcriptional repressor of nem operon
MPRPREFSQHTVTIAAKEEFWTNGYERTGIDDLHIATGLSRSSLYLAFGSKRELFDSALADYVVSFIDPMLSPMEAPGAGLEEAARFFAKLARLFRQPRSQRGCLMINAIADLAGRDPKMTGAGAQFANRYRAAFGHALKGAVAHGDMDRPRAKRKSELLAMATIGVWIAVRAEPLAAARSSAAVAAEIRSWSRT